MKASDRTILLVIAGIAAVAALWFLLLAPKREQVSTLDAEIGELRVAVQEEQQLAAEAEVAKSDYRSNYHRLVVLGKAAPAGEDTASLFVQLDEIARDSGIGLDTITLQQGSGAPAPTAAPTAAAQTTADDTGDTAATDTAATTPAVATEASAALLPLGATVGPAGLPVMPYELTLNGDYFKITGFVDRLQKLVAAKHGREIVDGRLVTIDSFEFTGDEEAGFPQLSATMHITTYVAPADQGLTAGATAAAPAPTTATAPAAVPASGTETAVTP
jgi:Tfp pilus assembly protein PilO